MLELSVIWTVLEHCCTTVIDLLPHLLMRLLLYLSLESLIHLSDSCHAVPLHVVCGLAPVEDVHVLKEMPIVYLSLH